MLNKIYDCLLNQYDCELAKNIKTHYTGGKLSSIYFRYDDDNVLSQITVWHDLSCHVEIFDIASNAYVEVKRVELDTIEDVFNEVNNFLKLVKLK